MINKIAHSSQLNVRINEESPLELVIGRDLIRNSKLADLFAHTFFTKKHVDNLKNTSLRPQETYAHIPRKQGTCTHSTRNASGVKCKKQCTTEPIEHNPAVDFITLPDVTTPVPPLMNQTTLAPPPPMTVRLESNNDTPLTDRAVSITPPTTGSVLTQTTRPLAALLR